MTIFNLLLVTVIVVVCCHFACAQRSFTIDFENDVFLKDGKPFQYISGSFHYSRVPSFYWEDRLAKMRAAGLNAVQIYVMWNFHQEVDEDHYDFSGDRDLQLFLTLAAKHDLLVIVRAGPYICGEWDFGGLPGWLLKKNESMVLRSSDRQYLRAVDKWMSVLLPLLKKNLYSEGGGVIMVQLENEYGSYYTCDKIYINLLYDMGRALLGDDVVLFTTDGGSYDYLKCGGLLDRRFYPTIDYGVGSTENLTATYADFRKYQPAGPLVNSEYYTGWLDHWGSPHEVVDAPSVAIGLKKMLEYGVNVNMYMFFGGTNFGYWNGANSPSFGPQPTSYDYDAPISEGGDTTWKYQLIREVIYAFTNQTPPAVPPNVTFAKYSNVHMSPLVHILQVSDKLTVNKAVNVPKPVSMESLGLYTGFALYETYINVSKSSFILSISLLRDLGLVYWSLPDNHAAPRLAGYFSWFSQIKKLNVTVDVSVPTTLKLQILVENAGHVNYGSDMFNNVKGILSDVLIDNVAVHIWNVSALDISRATHFMHDYKFLLKYTSYIKHLETYPVQGMLYAGSMDLSSGPLDSYIKFPSWCKGQVFINHVNLGRYWPCAGPQVTLYVPKSMWTSTLHLAKMFSGTGPKALITILELFDTSCPGQCEVEFTTEPELNGKHDPHHEDLPMTINMGDDIKYDNRFNDL